MPKNEALNYMASKNVSRRAFVGAGLGLAAGMVPALAHAEEAAGASTAEAVAAEPVLADDELSTGVPWNASEPNEAGEFSFEPEDALSEDDLEQGIDLLSSGSTISVTEIKGETRYETAAQIALRAYPTSANVIIASGESFADSLAAAGLAGALACPIVLVQTNSVPSAASSAIKSMKASHAIILGGTSAISEAAANQVKQLTGSVQRLAGPTRYETQLEIYNYGTKNGYWASDTAFVVSGENFPDALAASPISFALKAPIFFADSSKALSTAQLNAIKAATQFKNFVVAGGPKACVSDATVDQLKALSKSRGGYTKRLYGDTRYETSAEIAKYAVSDCGFSWNGLAFTSGKLPFDALAGAPLQGKAMAPLLLADSNSSVSAKAAANTGVNAITFLGGYQAIPVDTRKSVCLALGLSLYNNVAVTPYGITLKHMAELEANGSGSLGLSYSKFYEQLNPSNYSYGTNKFLQFALLNKGYSGVSASALSEYVADYCSYSESRYGRTSALRNAGNSFVKAAKQYGVNEVYLLAHAIWESGWGCSELACGWTATEDRTVVVNGVSYECKKGTTYYNFFGIGAVDSNALEGGRAYAVKEGWTSVEKAILGAGKWIAENYLNRSLRQNTLYLMKFDVAGAAKNNTVWHQYCTGGNSWAIGIGSLMYNCYSHSGYSVDKMPIKYDVPSYSA